MPDDYDAIIPCLDDHTGKTCEGPVEMRSLDGVKWWPRCDLHWDLRIDRYENSLEKWANSDVPPPWFDPTIAGERWDDD